MQRELAGLPDTSSERRSFEQSGHFLIDLQANAQPWKGGESRSHGLNCRYVPETVRCDEIDTEVARSAVHVFALFQGMTPLSSEEVIRNL